MQPELPDLDRLYRCARGDCTAEDRAALTRWLGRNRWRHALFAAIAAIAREPERIDARFDAMAAARRLRREMERRAQDAAAREPAQAALGRTGQAPPPPLRGSLRFPLIGTTGALRRRAAITMLAAALGAIGIGLGLRWFARGGDTVSSPRVEMTTITAAPGTVEEVRLPDGTRVSLAPASALTYPTAFAGPTRDVRLEGEGYFTVAHDSTKRFRVFARHGVAEVLGTAFSVRAYPGEPEVRVAVAEGRVAVGRGPIAGEQRLAGEIQRSSLGALAGSAIDGASEILGPGEVWRLTPDGQRHVERTDVGRYTAWTRGVLVFNGAPLSEVRTELARWFNVRLEFSDPSLATRRLTGSFGSMSVSEILAAIAPALRVNYEIHADRILISPMDRRGGGHRKPDR